MAILFHATSVRSSGATTSAVAEDYSDRLWRPGTSGRPPSAVAADPAEPPGAAVGGRGGAAAAAEADGGVSSRWSSYHQYIYIQ